MSRNETENVGNAILNAKAFEILLNYLKGIRKVEPELFINTIIQYVQNDYERNTKQLLNRLKLSEDETLLFYKNFLHTLTPEDKAEVGTYFLSELQEKLFYFAESGQIGTAEFLKLDKTERQQILENIKLTDEELKVISHYSEKKPNPKEPLLSSIQWKLSSWQVAGLFSTPPRPHSKERLIINLQEIKVEKNFRSPSELLRFVQSCIKKTFPKKAKLFTNEQVKEGVRWAMETKQKNNSEKPSTDKRFRSRTNITSDQWNSFMLALFGDKKPMFVSQYKKAVNNEVRKMTKHLNAPSPSKRQ